MTCTLAQQNLKAYLDRELALVERAQMRVHLAGCPGCRAELEAMKMISDEMKSIPTPEQEDVTREVVLAAARERRPGRLQRTGRRLRSLVVAGAGAGLVVVMLLLLVLRPSQAQAALEKVIAAAGQVKSFHTRFMVEQIHADPPVREGMEEWYQDGKWRMEDTRNGKLVGVQVYDGKRLHNYNVEKNTVYLNAGDKPFGNEFKGFTVAAMLQSMEGAEVGEGTATDKDGRTVNRFTITHHNERMVVLADPQTDLPLSAEGFALDNNTGEWMPAARTEVMEYDQPIEADKFVLTYPKDAEVVDRAKGELTKVEAKAEKVIARGKYGEREVVIRNLQVVNSGDVYIAWTGAVGPAFATQDEQKLTDNNGTEYLKQANAGLPRKVQGLWFVPVQGTAPTASWYELSMKHEARNPRSVTIRISEIQRVNGAEAVELFENYVPSGASRQHQRALGLAEYWNQKKDAARTVACLDEAVRLWEGNKGLQDYPAPEQWTDIGEKYQGYGCKEKAIAAYERALTEVDRKSRDGRFQYDRSSDKTERDYLGKQLRKLE